MEKLFTIFINKYLAIIVAVISAIVYTSNFISNLRHLKVQINKGKYSRIVIPPFLYKKGSINEEHKRFNYPYNWRIMINVLLINKSSKPITIVSFSSRGMKAMDSYTINDNYTVETNGYDFYFLKDHNFRLPQTIPPYGAIEKRIMLLATDKYITCHFPFASKRIKVCINTSRKNFFLSNKRNFKVNVTNIKEIPTSHESRNREPKLKKIDLGTFTINNPLRKIHKK